VIETAGLFRAFVRAARVLPPAADPPVAGAVAWLTGRFLPERERAARANLAGLFPDRDAAEHARLARRASAAYARFLLDYFRAMSFPSHALSARDSFTAPIEVVRALDQGRGLVVCAAHVGHWERGALALARLGRPVHVVARPQLLPAWARPIRQAKERGGISVVSPEGSSRTLARALREGEIVALLVDGAGYRRGRPACIAGRPVALPSGPARLAAATGAVVVGGTCLRFSPGRYHTSLAPLARTHLRPSVDVDELHSAIPRSLEQLLLGHPGEWCVFRPFFEAATAGGRG